MTALITPPTIQQPTVTPPPSPGTPAEVGTTFDAYLDETREAAADNADLRLSRRLTELEREIFQAVIQQAEQGKVLDDPKAFLNGLNAREMEVVRKAHGLADPIMTEGLDREGASNLLRAPEAYRDLNDDGFVNVGKGRLWRYPPPNAPQAVHDAWEAATEGMPEGEKWLAMAPFMVAGISANIKYDGQGRPVDLYGPDDLEYRNPYAEKSFSYSAQVRTILDQLSQWDRAAFHGEQGQFLTGFLEALESRGV